MRRYIDITDIEIPSDENDYDELVAFADAIAEQEIMELPERKKGKWVQKHFVWFCSECGENPTKGMGYVQGRDELYDFCPKCGADMRQGENDNV